MAELNPPEGPYVLTGPATDVEANKLRHSAAAFRRMLSDLIGRGLSSGIADIGDLNVTATGTDVNVSIAAGSCFILGSQAATQGTYHALNDATKVIPLLTNNPAHATLDRIDLVVARINDTFYSGALDTFSIEMVTGTPSGSPAVPAAPANSIILAQILIPHATSVVNPANITDKRGIAYGGHVSTLLPSIVSTIDSPVLPPSGWHKILCSISIPAAASTDVRIRCNGDTGANYDWLAQESSAGGAFAAPGGSPASAATFVRVGHVEGAGAGTVSEVLIPNGSSATQRKLVESRGYRQDGGNAATYFYTLYWGDWNNAAIISKLTFFLSAGNFPAGSRIDLELW